MEEVFSTYLRKGQFFSLLSSKHLNITVVAMVYVLPYLVPAQLQQR